MAKILIIEDEPAMQLGLKDNLELEGYTVDVANDGDAGLTKIKNNPYDLILLDVMLPEMDGFELCRQIRQSAAIGRTPVVFLTARSDEVDRVLGLEIGGDDYMTKPFSPRELVARVRSVLRRVDAAGAGGDVLRRGDLVIDSTRMQVSRNGAAIDLTPTEFQLFAALARQPGRIFTRAQLLDAVRGTDVDSFERAIDTHVKNIRRKIEADSHSPRYILTVYGMGYKFAES